MQDILMMTKPVGIEMEITNCRVSAFAQLLYMNNLKPGFLFGLVLADVKTSVLL